MSTPEHEGRKPSGTDIALQEISRRLNGIDAKLDLYFGQQAEFRREYDREMSASTSDRVRLREEMDHVMQVLYGGDRSSGLVAMVQRMFWIGIVASAIGGTIVAPVVVGLLGFAGYVFWQIVTGHIVIP